MACSLGLSVAPDVVHPVSERKTEKHKADSPVILPSPLPLLELKPHPHPGPVLIGLPDSGTLHNALHPRHSRPPSTSSFSLFSSFLSPSTISLINNIKLDSPAPTPLLEYILHEGSDVCLFYSLKYFECLEQCLKYIGHLVCMC